MDNPEFKYDNSKPPGTVVNNGDLQLNYGPANIDINCKYPQLNTKWLIILQNNETFQYLPTKKYLFINYCLSFKLIKLITFLWKHYVRFQ